jgi:hypothetical protein
MYLTELLLAFFRGLLITFALIAAMVDSSNFFLFIISKLISGLAFAVVLITNRL